MPLGTTFFELLLRGNSYRSAFLPGARLMERNLNRHRGLLAEYATGIKIRTQGDDDG